MSFANSISQARKKSALSQEEVAQKLDVSRQTISNWELGESAPDIYQAKKLANLYHLSLDDLFDFDSEINDIEKMIYSYDKRLDDKINWTKVWSKRYPILSKYQDEVDIFKYRAILRKILENIKSVYNYSEIDAMLVLKDILFHETKK